MKIILWLAALFITTSVAAQNQNLTNPGDGNFVVIGAFSVPKNALFRCAEAQKKGLTAEYTINPAKNLYYVYTMQTNQKALAFEEAKKIREGTSYLDTWVFNGPLGDGEGDITSGKVKVVMVEEESPEEVAASPAQNITASIDETKHVDIITPKEENDDANGKSFLFKLYSSGGKEVKGDIDMLDEKSKKLASYVGNEKVKIRPPNASGNVSLVCEVLGYKKIQKAINYNTPESNTDVTQGEGGEIIVPFELVRMTKGDIAIMYNVYFFKDAGVMRPESRTEVNSLVDMMKENLNYKIRIHGHTNGNSAGKILTIGEDKNFFSLSNTKEGRGSAKKLSQVRAEVIREYLVSEGIAETRMEIKAWGGKKSIYDKEHSQAQANVRVEIEIVED